MFSKYIVLFMCVILYSKICISQIISIMRGKDNSSVAYNKSYAKETAYGKWAARIMNGWPAKHGDVPYQISLKALSNRARSIYTSFCGATLVGPRKLISAAHCFEGLEWSCTHMFNPSKVGARALRGQYAVAGNLMNTAKFQLDSPRAGQWRRLESVQNPEKYKFPILDIAVAITYHPFYYNNFVKPIPMAVRNTDYSGQCLASGYGRTGHNKMDTSFILLLAHIQVHPIRHCNKLFRKPMHAFICTSIGLTDVGKGDSGGPLVCANTGDPNENNSQNGILVGVVSGHLTRTGSFFTRVSSYREFIDSVNSASMIMYKYTMHSCTAVATSVLYKIFVLFRFV